MVSLQDLNEGMTDRGAVLLVCPICRGELTLADPYRRLGRVRTGEIRCLRGCAIFPIIYGVPIMLLPGQLANWSLPAWKSFFRRRGKQELMKAVAAGQFDKESRVSGSPVTKKMLNKAKRLRSGVRLKSTKAHNEDTKLATMVERLRQIDSGVMLDVGCGGGFATEHILQEIYPPVYCVAIDIDFECIKVTDRRVELLGMSKRFMGICADMRHLPFADESFSVVYSLLGFWHMHRYVDGIREAHRVLKVGRHLVVIEKKSGRSLHPDSIGLFYEEQFELLHRLGLIAHGQEFIGSVKQAGFNILDILDELEKPRSPYFILDAIKG